MASTPDSIEQTIQELKQNMPARQTMSIQDNGGGHRIAIMAQAMRDAGAEAGDSVDEWWFEDRGLLVIDFGSTDE